MHTTQVEHCHQLGFSLDSALKVESSITRPVIMPLLRITARCSYCNFSVYLGVHYHVAAGNSRGAAAGEYDQLLACSESSLFLTHPCLCTVSVINELDFEWTSLVVPAKFRDWSSQYFVFPDDPAPAWGWSSLGFGFGRVFFFPDFWI